MGKRMGVVLALGAAAAVVAKRWSDDRAEQDLWAEATDPIPSPEPTG